jgi:hypothetical protein
MQNEAHSKTGQHLGITPTSEATDASAAASLAQVRDQLGALDENGRLETMSARVLRQVMTQLLMKFGREHGPGQHLGPFDTLPQATQRIIIRAIEANDRWEMAGHELGHWHVAITRLLHKLRHNLPRSMRLARKLATVAAAVSQNGPARGGYKLYRWQLGLRGKYAVRPTLAALLEATGLNVKQLAVCYARGIRQPETYRSLWHDPAQHNTVGVVLGIDLLPSADGYWFVESNLDCALRLERTALYSQDPFVSHLLDFASTQGYRHLVVLAGNSAHIDALMAKQYADGAAARKLKLTLIEDAYLPYSDQVRGFGIPPFQHDKTLVVRIKYYHTSLDYMLQHKWASNYALQKYKAFCAEPMLLLPPVGHQPLLGNGSMDEPFPNLVYKFPERDSGSGVLFFKATSPAHARSLLAEARLLFGPKDLRGRLFALQEDANGLYQPYIRPHLLDGRRLYIVRSHILLTPNGMRFLSAHRVVSGSTIPEHLPIGVVKDPRPYLVNYSLGAKYEIVPPAEEEAVKAATFAAAKGLFWAATYGFQTMAQEGKEAMVI